MHERNDQEESYRIAFQGDLLTGDFDPTAIGGSQVFQNDELLTIHAAARLAGVSRASMLSWIRNGFITAQTSPQGWMVRAGDIEKARNGADEARLGRAVDVELREDTTTLVADAEQTRERSLSLASRREASQQPSEQFGDAFLAPLAEFVRDQADVVQEQAETIGWLQAELRRARLQLEAAEETTEPSDDGSNAEPDAMNDDNSSTWDFDPFTDLPEKSEGVDPQAADEVEPQSAISDGDPFSEESDEVRMMIQETESKIVDLWNEQLQLMDRHSRPDNGDDVSWLRRLMSSWRKPSAD